MLKTIEMIKRLKSPAALALAAGALFCSGGAFAGLGVEPLTTQLAASGFNRPLFVTGAPGDYKRLYVVEQYTGLIRVLNLKTGAINATPFIDINSLVIDSGSERGLLGLAFHPDWETNRKFYVNYSGNVTGPTVIAEFTATTPDFAAPATVKILLNIAQPFTNHNGGWIGFGPNDGYLYIGMGDGGSGNDPGNRAQDITDMLLGKMLRIDVDGNDAPGGQYGIPPTNPYVGITGDDQIWAFGLRNPWRNAFDRLTGDLYIGDVGQDAWEEISYQPGDSTGGENYGWRICEGNHSTPGLGTNCPALAAHVPPIQEYSHTPPPPPGTFVCTVVGGYVYRGCKIPSLDGQYFYAEYCANRIWSFEYTGAITNFVDRTAELDPPGALSITSIVSFGEDTRGEMYIADINGGEVFRIVPVTPTISPYDVNCDGTVGFADLTELLLNWGPCDGCLTDFNDDLSTGFGDLTDVLLNWG